MFGYELRRRNVVKLVAVRAEKPITIPQAMAYLFKTITAQLVGEPQLAPLDRPYAGLTSCEIVHDVPRAVHAARVKDMDLVSPSQEPGKGLCNDVVFIAGDQNSVKGHFFAKAASWAPCSAKTSAPVAIH